MKLVYALLISFIFFTGVTLGHNLGKLERFKWIQNQPLATHVHKDKTCFEWETKYNTQLIACVRRAQ